MQVPSCVPWTTLLSKQQMSATKAPEKAPWNTMHFHTRRCGVWTCVCAFMPSMIPYLNTLSSIPICTDRAGALHVTDEQLPEASIAASQTRIKTTVSPGSLFKITSIWLPVPFRTRHSHQTHACPHVNALSLLVWTHSFKSIAEKKWWHLFLHNVMCSCEQALQMSSNIADDFHIKRVRKGAGSQSGVSVWQHTLGGYQQQGFL